MRVCMGLYCILLQKYTFDFYTSFERSLSKLSENHKIVDIGSTVLKL